MPNRNAFTAHSSAIVESDDIGGETRIWAYAHVLRGARIGTRCNIGDHCFVESGAVIGNNVTLKNHVCVWEGVRLADDVFVGPLACFTNDLNPRSPRMAEVGARYAEKRNWLTPTIVERGCTIGANATIVAGVTLGEYSFIAAGAVVTADVEPYALVMGCPARQVGHVCRCGQRRDEDISDEVCPQCGIRAVDLHHHSGQIESL